MKNPAVSRGEKAARSVSVLACVVFALITFARVLPGGRYEQILLAGVTVPLVLAPWLVERLFRCKILTVLYLFCLFYAIGPMLGVCYQLYYRISWWDKMLHIFGGIAFAIFGVYLFEFFGGEGNRKHIFTALFALCLSIAVSVVWEFAEFGADQFLGMDMQSDWVIHSIHSYSIGESMGSAGTIEHIQSVAVNGVTLPVEGYLDIGLTDTMLDMLLESLGAAAVSVLYLVDRGRHPVLVKRDVKQ